MRKAITIALFLSLVVACGNPAAGGGPTSKVPSTTMANPDHPADSGGDEPISETLPSGDIPNPRLPIEGSVNGEVSITETELLIMESFPIQVSLHVEGQKPTPCHEVFWTAEDNGEVIAIEMISQISSDQSCAQVVEPFIISVPLGSWSEESRIVELNGAQVGSFDS